MLYAAIAALLLILIVGAGMAIANHEKIAGGDFSSDTDRAVVEHADPSDAAPVLRAVVVHKGHE
ncbi:hypothetical protein [Nocardia paucivorans]|uniref:hypothetical protein n=1 Tax=Nocardia paucivorans TaxID=114259 RepID=UPI0003000959